MEEGVVADRDHFVCEAGGASSLVAFGFHNPKKSNTCYANSVLQSLLALESIPLTRLAGLVLREKMLLWKYLVELNREIESVSEGASVTLTKEFIQQIGVGKYGEQQDAHEFFMLLVAKLDAEALTAPAGKKKKKKKNKSAGFSEVSKSGAPIVVKTLGVAEEKGPLTLLFELVVTNKKQNKRVMEPCLGLSVPLSDNWPSQVKLLAIEQLAPVVCVHLVRESDDYGTLLKSHVDPTSVLSFQTMLFKDQAYELHSCVLHQGESLFKGHYVARVKNSGGKWSIRDDAKVTPIENVHEKLGPFIPYLLFYKKKQK